MFTYTRHKHATCVVGIGVSSFRIWGLSTPLKLEHLTNVGARFSGFEVGKFLPLI